MVSPCVGTMYGTLDGMELEQRLTVFQTNDLLLSLHEGTVTPRSLSLSATVSVTLHYLILTLAAPKRRRLTVRPKHTLRTFQHRLEATQYTPIKGAQNTQQYASMQHTTTKINNYSRSIAKARSKSSGRIHHRSLHDVVMAPDSQALVRADVHIARRLRST
jgi:hypothetical protein